MAKKQLGLTYNKMIGGESLSDEYLRGAEEMLARLVALALKADRPELFGCSSGPSGTLDGRPNPAELR